MNNVDDIGTMQENKEVDDLMNSKEMKDLDDLLESIEDREEYYTEIFDTLMYEQLGVFKRTLCKKYFQRHNGPRV